LSLLALVRELAVPALKSLSCFARIAPFLLAAALLAHIPSSPQRTVPHSHLGFDRNIYPGDDALPILRKTFAFSSFWLSPPPGEKTNTWHGKRELLLQNGFGFLVLFRGREEKELNGLEDASRKADEDARATVEAAKREGFGPQTIIYLDIEEGGRLSSAYHRYLMEWLWQVSPVYFQGGFYCSGIPVKEGKGRNITACQDIFDDLAPRSRAFSLWVYNDVCPPSPGCAFPENPPPPSLAGKDFCEDCVAVWQFAQSPRRKEFTSRCPANYHRDGNCYAPFDTRHFWFLDLNAATSADPSKGTEGTARNKEAGHALGPSDGWEPAD